MAKILPFLLLSLVFVGCAKKADRGAAPTIHPEPVLEGSLTDNVQKNQAGSYVEPCESDYFPKQLEISKALDKRREQLASFRELNVSTETASRKTLGPAWMTMSTPPSNPPSGWQIESSSWKEIIEMYEKVKNQEVNSGWVDLETEVKSIVEDDRDRVVYGYNYYLENDAPEKLTVLKAEIDLCLNDPQCLEPVLSESSKAFVDLQPDYRPFYRNRGDGSQEVRRRRVETWSSWVNLAEEWRSFRPNETMRVVSPDHYELPIDLGVFSEVADEFKYYVESVWTAPGKQVRLKSESKKANPDLFQVFLNMEAGGRSYVVNRKKTVTLYNGLKSRAIAHEFGHVMGFPDNYFYVWRPSQCGYEIQGRADDLMSYSGLVLPSHWETLAKKYGSKTP